MNPIPLKFHLTYNFVYVIIIAILALSVWQWQREHDLRIKAEQFSKDSEARVADLKDQNQKLAAEGEQKKQTIVRVVQEARTPTQQAAAISNSEISQLPVALRPLPNSSDYVLPYQDLAPLLNQLSLGQQARIDNMVCQSQLDNYKKIDLEHQNQAKEWKKAAGAHGFLGKVWDKTKEVIPLAIVYLAATQIPHK